jgi:hypothetical protein
MNLKLKIGKIYIVERFEACYIGEFEHRYFGHMYKFLSIMRYEINLPPHSLKFITEEGYYHDSSSWDRVFEEFGIVDEWGIKHYERLLPPHFGQSKEGLL